MTRCVEYFNTLQETRVFTFVAIQNPSKGKKMIKLNKLCYPILIIASVAIVGCSSKVKDEDKHGDKTQISLPSDGTSGVGNNSGTGTDMNGAMIPSQRVIYFDYDSDLIRDDARTIMEGHAAYLVANNGVKIRLEGHADERGSREYNLALGERRAESVKHMLNILGVQDGQMQTLSYGEENPSASGHEESSWQQNRRVEFIYP